MKITKKLGLGKRTAEWVKANADTKNFDLRSLASIKFAEHKLNYKWINFIKTNIFPVFSFQGKKIKEKQKIAVLCIHNLCSAYLRKRTVADNRDNSKNTLRISMWDTLQREGFVKSCIGSESSGFITRYYPTDKLISILIKYKGSKLSYKLARNTIRKKPVTQALVVLRNKKKEPIPFNLSPLKLNSVKMFEDKIEIINQQNQSHSWQAFGIDPSIRKKVSYEPNFCIRQIHSEMIAKYTGLHSWDLSIQSLSKSMRKQILIDNEPITELDFSGYLIRLVYHTNQIEPGDKDIYMPQFILPKFYKVNKAKKRRKIVRFFIKKATNICLNVSTKHRALLAINEVIRKSPKKKMIQKIFKMEKITLNQLVKRIVNCHLPIKRYFFSNVGETFMTMGSMIVFDILWEMCKLQKPAYPIHDCILCKLSDSTLTFKIMKQVYKKFYPAFKPIIKQKY